MPDTGVLDVEPALIGLSEDLPDWYEAGLSAMERKRRGHYSTPLPLVDQILDACGYTLDADLARVRVFDPACGSGNFLVGAARRLLASLQRMGYSLQEQRQLLTRNIWGFDPDPVACLLSKMRLAQFAGTWHIHQADSLALHWEPCAELLLANPPYLAAKNSDLSGYRSALQRGQADSYLLFLSVAMQAVRPGGWIGLVLPDPVLARWNAAREREQLLRHMTLFHLWHLSDVFAAEVGAVVLVARNVPPTPIHHIAWERARWQPSAPLASTQAPGAVEAQRIAQALLLRQPAAELRYLLSGEHGALFDRLRSDLEDAANGEGERRLVPLSDFVTISRGEELGRESQFIRREADMPGVACRRSYAVLRGGVDMRPYALPPSAWRIDHEAVTKPMERYLSPKLLVVKSTNRLQAVLDSRGHVALQTLYLLHIRKRCAADEQLDCLYFLLALLNSRLLREYTYVLHTAYKWVQPQIEQRVLASLPVPLVEVEDVARREVIDQAKWLERACSEGGAVVEWNEEINARYEALECTIRALYAAASGMCVGDKGVSYG